MVDIEKRREIALTQTQYTKNIQQRRINATQAQILEDQKKREVYKQTQLLKLKSTQKGEIEAYTQVGRVFLSRDISDLVDMAKKNTNYIDENLAKLAEQRAMLSKTIDKQEKTLRDFMEEQKKEQQKRSGTKPNA